MHRAYYSDSIDIFLKKDTEKILGILESNNEYPLELTARDAWYEEIAILKTVLKEYQGGIYFEYSIPRMGKRIDVVLLIGPVVFVLEFKIGADEFFAQDIDQVWDYALDLKYFLDTCHDEYVAPLLIASEAESGKIEIIPTLYKDKLFDPIRSNDKLLGKTIKEVLNICRGNTINIQQWGQGRYQPTPTIIEAAMALYNGHSVEEISRSDAGAKNLNETSNEISRIIQHSKENQ